MLEQKWSCKLFKLPIDYKLDYAIESSEKKVEGFCEIKCRKNNSTDFKTFILSSKKYKAGVSLSQIFRVPFFIVVCWLDAIKIYEYSHHHTFHLEIGGRTKQFRSKGDIEPVIHIPIKRFKKIAI